MNNIKSSYSMVTRSFVVAAGFVSVLAFAFISAPSFSYAADYGYVNHYGYVALISANSSSGAIDAAASLGEHSGVILMDSQSDRDLVGNKVFGM